MITNVVHKVFKKKPAEKKAQQVVIECPRCAHEIKLDVGTITHFRVKIPRKSGRS